MESEKFNILLKKALMLETVNRTQFLNAVDDAEARKKLEYILNDETRSTDYILNTSIGNHTLLSPDVSEFEAGDKIKQFTIIKLIAKGGMGSVYLAYDDKLRRNVALKSIRSEYLNSESTRKRFRQEAIILSKINHPSICQIYDIIEGEKSELLVLELVYGDTLSRLKLSHDKLLDVFLQIASALNVAHAKGVIHRDLKPDNIMLNEDGIVKILDFGIAKSQKGNESPENSTHLEPENELSPEADKTKMGIVMGTLIYMSPEQASGKAVGKESDIYSLGIIMQELLTGRDAYEMENTENLRQQVMDGNIVKTTSLPKGYITLIELMTQRRIEDRPTAKLVIEKLEKIKNSVSQKKSLVFKIASALAIVLLLSFVIWQQRISTENSKKQALINGIQKDIDDLGVKLKNIYMLPLHDVRDEKKHIRNKKKNIEQKIDSLDSMSLAQKHMLIGMMHMSTLDYEIGLTYLNKAWEEGVRTEEIAYDLANANSLVFQDKLSQFLIQNGYIIDKNNKKIIELEKQYLQPAEKYLKLSTQDKQNSNNMAKALIVWANNDIDTAIEALNEVIKDKDWLFEAYTLKAAFIYSKAQKLAFAGKKDEALKFWVETLNTYKKARERGRSFPSAYSGICAMNINLMLDGFQRTGKDITENYEEGVESCTDLLAIYGYDSETYSKLSKLHYYYAISLMNIGVRKDELLYKALEYNGKAIESVPSFINYNSRSEIYNNLAQSKNYWGGDPRKDIENSILASEKTLELGKYNKVFVYSTLMSSISLKVNYETNTGVDSTDNLNLARQYYTEAMQLDDITDYTKLYFLVNTGIFYNAYIRNQILRGENFENSFNTVLEIVSELESVNDEELYSKAVKAEAYLLMAEYGNPEKSIENINLSLENIKKTNELVNNSGGFLAMEAYIRGVRNGMLSNQPSANLDFNTSFELFEKSIQLNGSFVDIYVNYSKICLLAALHMSDRQNIKKVILKGVDVSNKAIETNPDYSLAYLQKAKLIDYALRHQIEIPNTAKDADEAFAKAISINPLLSRDNNKGL